MESPSSQNMVPLALPLESLATRKVNPLFRLKLEKIFIKIDLIYLDFVKRGTFYFKWIGKYLRVVVTAGDCVGRTTPPLMSTGIISNGALSVISAPSLFIVCWVYQSYHLPSGR